MLTRILRGQIACKLLLDQWKVVILIIRDLMYAKQCTYGDF